ncbi:tripartite tricarboxylate transporter permease [Pseudonocardia sp. DSM 110487]|uniref:tripartite tricarboxylate transporter permease n=1 Tax=Pseudonocardia sp. DSM 110487 TaxID=2865833 RepID=UPI001C698631|nr:tripartite tricarboxylate transporter permease [Pseudonocardia sp. DSM 110487]QYN38985.1 tripartite tricarboxylate transporter permease [Pseudonocardia sp. DSM 110487]
MDVLGNLLVGFAGALSLQNLALALVGTTLGSLVGVLPGLGPATTVALLLPLTYVFDPTGALVLFAGIYYGGMYGGSTTAILLNVPGETASVPTTLEGFPMAKSGRAGAALATAAIGSFVAGTLSTVGITFLAPAMSAVAKLIQPAEYVAIMVLAFVTVTSLVGRSVVRGLCSLFLGIAVGMIGIDSLTGQARYAFGVPELYDGIEVVALAVGLFAIAEALYTVARHRDVTDEPIPLRGRIRMNREDWARSWRPWLRGTAIGLPIGALPAGGAEIPTFLSYNLERRLTKHPEEFGKGAIEGVAGPEAANNAAFSGVLMPLLTLGIPTSATAGVLLIAFQIYNVQPGPQLFDTQPVLVWTLIASLYIGNVMLLVLNVPLIPLWIKILKLPTPILTTGILVFAILGAYATAQNVTDVLIAIAFGLIGFVMRRTGYPVAPLILGAVLGPMLETQFRRALAFSEGDLSVFVTRPIAATILTLALIALVGPAFLRRSQSRARGGRTADAVPFRASSGPS